MAFTREEIYGCDLGEYCRLTYISPDLLVMAEKAKIEMLQKNYEKLRKCYQKEPLGSDRSKYLGDLLLEITKKKKRAEDNLRRYKEEKEAYYGRRDTAKTAENQS